MGSGPDIVLVSVYPALKWRHLYPHRVLVKTVNTVKRCAFLHVTDPVLSFLICKVGELLGKKNRAGNSKLSRGSI